MFFVLYADKCFLVYQKQADNETSGRVACQITARHRLL